MAPLVSGAVDGVACAIRLEMRLAWPRVLLSYIMWPDQVLLMDWPVQAGWELRLAWPRALLSAWMQQPECVLLV